MEKKKNKLLSVLANLDIIVACTVLVALIIMTFMGVIYRYAIKHPFTWLEEVQMACMVWIVFAAGGAAFRTGNHVAIEMIVDMFPKKVQKAFEWCIAAVVCLVLAYLFYQSLGFINIFVKSGRATSMLKIPYTLIYGIAPVSFVVMVVSYIFSLVKGVKSEAKEAIEE